MAQIYMEGLSAQTGLGAASSSSRSSPVDRDRNRSFERWKDWHRLFLDDDWTAIYLVRDSTICGDAHSSEGAEEGAGAPVNLVMYRRLKNSDDEAG
jgi:hypothetical protein